MSIMGTGILIFFRRLTDLLIPFREEGVIAYKKDDRALAYKADDRTLAYKKDDRTLAYYED